MRTRELVEVSVGAVRGQVTAIASAPEPRDGGVSTYITLAVDEVLFGPLSTGTLVLRERGGQVGDRQEWTFGSATFRVGERVLVFLSPNADGTLHTTEMAMGKFTLARRLRRAARDARARPRRAGAGPHHRRPARHREGRPAAGRAACGDPRRRADGRTRGGRDPGAGRI